MDGSALLLVLSVAVVGVLHTVVPDHWVPITLMARQRGWSKAETATAALTAGPTLAISDTTTRNRMIARNVTGS